jgi:hypothetical protein
MSISALLSTSEEPAIAHNNNTPSHIRVSPTTQRHQITEMQLQRSPESARPNPKHTNNSRPVAPSYNHTYDADATDSDHEPTYQAAVKKSGFRDFKYHDSMKLEPNLDESDSDEDSDEFITERIEYMKNIRKRQINLEEQETQKRKVELIHDILMQ